MDKLLNCPFCGGKAEWHCFPLDYPNTQVRAYVKCSSCETEISRDGRVSESKQLLKSAIEAWNRRDNLGR